MRSELRKALSPVKRRLTRLRGWAYWSKRRLRPAIGAAPAINVVAASGLPGAVAVPVPVGALDCVVASNTHGVYCVPRSSQHRPVAQAILQARVWESDTLDLMRAADRDGDIVHAGTFFGDFLPALARSRGKGAVVWAFEPGRENYRCAQITVMLNDLENVALSHAALDVKHGSALLATSDRAGLPLGGASRIIKDPARARWADNEEVKLVAVDEVVGSERQVAVIQLDVEGHEQEALAGAMLTIERCRPLIVLETVPENGWLAANLEPLGYRVEGSVTRNSIIRCGTPAPVTTVERQRPS
jgi:FkbM family methyltransferase